MGMLLGFGSGGAPGPRIRRGTVASGKWREQAVGTAGVALQGTGAR